LVVPRSMPIIIAVKALEGEPDAQEAH
jgi:hypothetical protein